MVFILYMESQFLTIAIAHLLAVVSPGPDFILISRQTIKYGRKVSIYTSLGIAVGILFHISYCVIGIEILLEQNYFTNILTILCGSYLLYLGLSSFLISNKQVYDVQDNVSKISITNLKAFMLGFFTNILNIKADDTGKKHGICTQIVLKETINDSLRELLTKNLILQNI